MFTQKHPFHLVDPSPWPLITSSAAFISTTGAVLYMHGYSGGFFFIFFSIFFLVSSIAVWWRDVIREGTFEGQHTSIVQLGLRYGILLFIVSEIIFFFAFFWAFFWAALAPTPEIGSVWPPKGIETLSAWEVPLLNTIILVSSGVSVTWAHHAIVVGEKKKAVFGLLLTVIFAIIFTALQVFEYFSANFTIADSIFGSTFFMATGFHGFHVFIGTCFLSVCFFRLLLNHYTKQHHFGFEAAAWYWHFVDVVWLFLFVSIYWWGSLLLSMNFFYSPLEQFEIFPVIFCRVGFFDLSFTNSSFFLLFGFFLVYSFYYCSSIFGGFLVPNRWQQTFELFFKFVFDIVFENIGKKGQIFFPFIFCLFTFLLVFNLLGLVPYSFTVTSHFIITFILSIVIWVGKLILGFRIHGLKLFGLLLPGGLPVAMIPFFVIVELVSFFIPLVALGVRLFANIIAGHILLKVIVGFCWSIMVSSGFFFLLHFLPIGVLFLLLFLETAVAFIQAYVFSILSCLIIGDILRGGH